MASSTIAIIILIAVIILFAIEKIPLVITATLAMLAMFFTGIIPYAVAFSGFSSWVLFMIIGMSMISSSFFTVGLSEKIGQLLMRFTNTSERTFVLILFILAIGLSAFFNAMIIVVMFSPIIDIIAAKTEGRISRKMSYMPLSFGSVIGSPATSIGASCLMTASAMLADSFYGRGFMLFEPLKVGFPGIIVSILFYLMFGYKLQKKWFDFSENTPDLPASSQDFAAIKMTWRMWFVLLVTITCIILFMAGLNMGVIALAGACILILSGCITAKEAFHGVSWETVFTVAASLGFAQGIDASGAAQVITDMIFELCGPLGRFPFIMCIIVFSIAILLSTFMSNNATVVVLMPVALILAQTLNVDAMAFALACAVGSEIAIAMPICSAAVTYTISVGYRNKDYIRLGGILTILMFLADTGALWFWFFR